jgi:branched-chain amino acid transport system permease protein
MIQATILGIDSFREVGQLFVNGVVNGTGSGLLGAAFALILGSTGRFHFALATNYTLSAFIAAVLIANSGWPFAVAVIAGLLVAAVSSVLCEALVYRPLAARAGVNTLLSVFVASLGIVIVAQNALQLAWGSTPIPLNGPAQSTLHFLDLTMSSFSVGLIIVTLVLLVALEVILRRTSIGRQILAVRVNPLMASSVGVDVQRIFLVIFFIGGLLAGAAAIFQGMRFSAAPDMGTTPVFYAMVVAFIAGASRGPLFALAIGLAIGVIESESTLWLTATLSSAVVFGFLLIYLSQTQLRAMLERTRRRTRRARQVRAASGSAATMN